jgi:PKD repeat protein
MNPKEMSVSIVTAMMVMVIFASTASAIVVDGDGSDWVGLTNVKCIDDDTGEIGTAQTSYFVNGYDIARFCVYYDNSSDTLYFKTNINVSGVPGDTDGDGNPNTSSDPTNIADNNEVGYGETYSARLDIDGDGCMDYDLKYSNNVMTMSNFISGATVMGTAVGSIGSYPYTDTVVEMSFSPAHNISGFGDCNTEFKARGWAANEYDLLGEDITPVFSVNKAPICAPVGEDVCYCTNTSFNGSGSYDPDGTIVLYEWDFDGDGTTDATGVTASYHFAVGDHTVTLTVTDDYGFKCTSATTVWVYENPIANFTVTEVDFGTPTEFMDTTTDGTPPYTHRWDFDNDGIYELDGTHPNPTHTYPASGDYTACLHITDYHGCTDEVCKPVHVENLPPVAEFDFTGTGCKEGILNASASYDPDGYITVYEWDLDNDGIYGDGTGAVTCPFSPDTVPPEDYWIGLKVTDDADASNTTRKQVSLTGDPKADATANGSNGPVQIPGAGKMVTFCGNESYHPYSADGAYIVSYNWTILGVAYSTTNPDECFDVFINETTIARLTVVDNYGCTGTDTVSLQKPKPPSVPVPLLTPAGMLALIGMLCIVGVGRILTREGGCKSP